MKHNTFLQNDNNLNKETTNVPTLTAKANSNKKIHKSNDEYSEENLKFFN